MLLDRYGEIFYTEAYEMGEYVQKQQIIGLFVQRSSAETESAAADIINTRGRFITTLDAPVSAQMSVKRASDGARFRLVGAGLRPPPQAFAQIIVFDAAEIYGEGGECDDEF